VELECAGLKGGLESGDKLAAEDTAEHLDGKEEGAARGDPAGMIWSETAGGNHAVDMGMMLQSLVPSMEHAEEADLRAEVPGIAGDLQQGGSTGVKQQVVDQPFILPNLVRGAILLSVLLHLLWLNAPKASAQTLERLEAGGNYNYVRANAPPGGCGCFSMNGGAGWFAYNFTQGPAVVGEVGSIHGSDIDGTTSGLTVTSFLFGPRLSSPPADGPA